MQPCTRPVVILCVCGLQSLLVNHTISASSPAGIPSLQPRADAAAARLAALVREAQQQQQALLDLVAAHEAVVSLASAKLARWELATSGGPAPP